MSHAHDTHPTHAVMSLMDPGASPAKEPSGREKLMDFLQEVKIELVGAKEEFAVRLVGGGWDAAWVGGGVHDDHLTPTKTHINPQSTYQGAAARRGEAADEGDGPSGRREGLFCPWLL